MESIKHLSQRERRHFMKCECGHYFDMRDLNDVVRHLHKFNALKVEYSHSVKVGESVAYSRKKRKLGLN